MDQVLKINFWDLSKYFDTEVVVDVMDALYRAGVRGKLYKLWYEFNSKIVVQVVTAGGKSEEKTTGTSTMVPTWVKVLWAEDSFSHLD